MKPNLSPVEKGIINKKMYAAYVADLKAKGDKFPINNYGEVNLSRIAKECGFNRQVFSNNTSMKQALSDDVKLIGTDITKGSNKESRLAKKVNKESEESSRLKKELDARVQEIVALKEQIVKLEAEIQRHNSTVNRMDLAMNELLTSGRRFSL